MDTFKRFSDFVGCLVGPAKKGLSTHQVALRFREVFEVDIAFAKMGYPNLEALLVACEKEGKIKKMGANWFIVANASNKHIINLVMNTKAVKIGHSRRDQNPVPSMPRVNQMPISGAAFEAAFPPPRLPAFHAIQPPRDPTNLPSFIHQSKSCASGLNQPGKSFFGTNTTNLVGYAHTQSGSGANLRTHLRSSRLYDNTAHEISKRHSKGPRLNAHESNGIGNHVCYGPSSMPIIEKKGVQSNVENVGESRCQPKSKQISSPPLMDSEENIAAHLIYRWLRMANGAMTLNAITSELTKWRVHTRGILLKRLLAIHGDMFHFYWDLQECWVYLSGSALPPMGKCSLGTSPRLGPMIMSDVIGQWSPGSQWQMVCPESLTYESYRWTDCHRFKMEFLTTDEAAMNKLDRFHQEMHAFYHLHWEDVDYKVLDFVRGGHYVIHDKNRGCVRRVRLDGEAADGTANVFLMDELRSVVIQRSEMRRLSDGFASVPSFGVVLYSPPFRVLDGAEQELIVAFNRLKRSFVSQNCDLQINVNHDHSMCRLLRLKSTINRNVCLPDCLEDDHFIMMESKSDESPFSASDDDDMWGEE